MKTGRQLERQYYKEHPEKKHPTMKKIGRGLMSAGKTLDKKVVDYNRRNQGVGSYRPHRSSSSHQNYNPFGSMFDTGMKPPTRRKKTSRTKYAVVGGRAYPVGPKKQKKKKKKRKTNSFGYSSGFDMFDNKGW